MSKKDIETRPRVVLVNRAVVIDNDKILLLKRSKNDSNNPGKWEFPGGKLDEGQDLSDALEREVMEEAHLAITPINKTAHYTSGIITEGKYKGLVYIQLYGVVKKVGGSVRLSHEHDDYKWVTVDEAYDMDIGDDTRKALLVLEDEVRSS